jgi:hypothetical protein
VSRVIYFARVGDYLKVGMTTVLERRITELRSAGHRRKQLSPAPLCEGRVPVSLIATIPHSRGLEAGCMDALRDHHVIGEWFRLNPEALLIVARLRADAAERAA